MEEEKKKELKRKTDGRGITDFIPDFRESVRVPPTKTESKKVPSMVGTFLKEDSDGGFFKRVIGYSYLKVVLESVRVLTTQTASEKVTDMVGTFYSS